MATWDKVRAVLAEKSPLVRAGASRAATPAPLKGLIHCGHCGRAMAPTYTRKQGRLYRYYTCMKAIRSGHGECPVRSVAAGEIEAAVIGQVRALLKATEIQARVERLAADIPPADVRSALAEFDRLWDELFPAEQARILELLVEKVAVHPGDVELKLRIDGLASVVADMNSQRKRKAA
ncbi:conserved hypothetical protein [Rhodospirillaceae bacterium LM-1]|nr:conserved hypothetical protein [Rhodospirillaceae bacterium LM-1]